MLIDSLPEGFKYRVKKLKINEKSDVKEYVKFQAQIQVNICEKDKAEKFIQMIKNKNDTEMKPTKKEIQRKGFRSQCFNCSRNVRINKNIYMYRFLTFPVLRITLPAWIRVHQQDIQTQKFWCPGTRTLVPLQEYQPFFCLNLKNQHKEFDFLFFRCASIS